MSVFTYRCPMRWSDLDAQGHVNNAVYVDYLQEARVEYLSSGPNAELLGRGIIVTRNQVEFLRSLEYHANAELTVRLWLSEVGGSRFVVRYEILDGDQLAARAATTLAIFDMDSGRLRRLTNAQRAVFRADIRESEPMPALTRVRWRSAEHRSPLRVRWSDLDSYGHVNNYRFYDYAQEARTRMILGCGWTPPTDQPKAFWLAVRQDCEYLSQLTFRPAGYQMASVVTRFGKSTLHIAHELRDEDGTVYAAIRTVLVHANAATGRPAQLPEGLRETLAQWKVG